MGKQYDRLGSLTSFKQSVSKKENSDFKLALLRLKIVLV